LCLFYRLFWTTYRQEPNFNMLIYSTLDLSGAKKPRPDCPGRQLQLK
jgi:hypothetical protein